MKVGFFFLTILFLQTLQSMDFKDYWLKPKKNYLHQPSSLETLLTTEPEEAVVKNDENMLLKIFEASYYLNPNLLIPLGNGARPILIEAIKNNNKDIIQLLIVKGARVNWGTFTDHREAISELPLITATANGNLPIVKMLVANGAALNKQIKDGYHALYYAIKLKNISMAHYLLEQNANPNLPYGDLQESVLFECVRTEQIKMIQLLLEYNADPTFLNEDGETPITFAQKSNRLDIVLLLEKTKRNKYFLKEWLYRK